MLIPNKSIFSYPVLRMPTLTLVRGLPGSGKSTYARGLQAAGAVHLEADMYFIVHGTYAFDATRLMDAHRWCGDSAYVSLNHGKDVVVSNTFTYFFEIDNYIQLAQRVGAALAIVELSTQFEQTHNVPEITIERMRDRWWQYDPAQIPMPVDYRLVK